MYDALTPSFDVLLPTRILPGRDPGGMGRTGYFVATWYLCGDDGHNRRHDRGRRRDRRLLRLRARAPRRAGDVARARAVARLGVLGRERRARLPEPLRPDLELDVPAERAALDVEARLAVLPPAAAGRAAVARALRAR